MFAHAQRGREHGRRGLPRTRPAVRAPSSGPQPALGLSPIKADALAESTYNAVASARTGWSRGRLPNSADSGMTLTATSAARNAKKTSPGSAIAARRRWQIPYARYSCVHVSRRRGGGDREPTVRALLPRSCTVASTSSRMLLGRHNA
jgi:hypothetical protein